MSHPHRSSPVSAFSPEKLNPPSQKLRRIKVAVLMGGISREREISIESGTCVADSLKQAGVNVIGADIKPDHLEILDDKSIDVFFVALHGSWGEDGTLQEILESKGLVYTGSPPKASRLAFDKWASKEYFTKAGVPSPDAVLFEPKLKGLDSRLRGNDNKMDSRLRGNDNKMDSRLRGNDKAIDDLRKFGPASTRQLVRQRRDLAKRRVGGGRQRYVVKPLREGSTIGISIADNAAQALEDAKKCAAEFGDCMIEKFINGREITVGVLGNIALPILEIRAPGGFYDYQAKYLDDKTQYLFDTINDAALTAKIQQSAVDCFNALGCRGAARVDFILTDDSKPYVLEINTIPGMTSHSLLPKAAGKIGISMSQLCIKMVEMAMAEAKGRKQNSKFEIRNPKQIQITETQNPKQGKPAG